MISLSQYQSMDEAELLTNFEDEMAGHALFEEALDFVCGYVAFRYQDKYPFLGIPGENQEVGTRDHEWISHISRGKLWHPSTNLTEVGRVMCKKFYEMHGRDFDRGPGVFQRLKEATKVALGSERSIPDEVILCMARCMTWFRVRRLNEQLKTQCYVRKANKKLQKVSQRKVVTL